MFGLREMVIPIGTAGYVALFEVESVRTVNILVLKGQREEDYQ